MIIEVLHVWPTLPVGIEPSPGLAAGLLHLRGCLGRDQSLPDSRLGEGYVWTQFALNLGLVARKPVLFDDVLGHNVFELVQFRNEELSDRRIARDFILGGQGSAKVTENPIPEAFPEHQLTQRRRLRSALAHNKP